MQKRANRVWALALLRSVLVLLLVSAGRGPYSGATPVAHHAIAWPCRCDVSVRQDVEPAGD